MVACFRPGSQVCKFNILQEGLADVISLHEMLANQILLFHSETVATTWLQYARFSTSAGAVLGLQIKQAVNYEY